MDFFSEHSPLEKVVIALLVIWMIFVASLVVLRGWFLEVFC